MQLCCAPQSDMAIGTKLMSHAHFIPPVGYNLHSILTIQLYSTTFHEHENAIDR